MTDAAPTHDHAVHPTSGAAESGAGCDPATEVAAIQAHADLVFATCRRVLGNDQDAADAAQEVFVAWLRGGRRIRGSVAAWLHGAAVRRCLDLRRRQHRRAGHEAGFARQSALESPDATDGPDHHALRAIVDEALHQLDAPSRALLLEHHVLGRSQGELATRFRTTQATISRRLAKAAEALKAALRRRGVVAPAVFGGVMSGVLSAQANAACPTALSAPLLAQAQVAGSAALTGATTMTLSSLGGGALVLKIAGWTAVALLALTVGTAVVVWNAYPLPPVPDISALLQKPIRNLDGPWPEPRYPTIEAVIASQSPVDTPRQLRLAAVIERPDALLREDEFEQEEAAIKAAPDPDNSYAITVEKDLAPLEALLDEGPLRSDAGGLLEADYRSGLLGPATRMQRLPNARLIGFRRDVERRFQVLLRHRPTDRHLAHWIRWCEGSRGDPCTMTESLVSWGVSAIQDRIATDLDLSHRLPPGPRAAWLALAIPRTIRTAAANGLATETIPWLSDLQSGRSVVWGEPPAGDALGRSESLGEQMIGLVTRGGDTRAWWTWQGWTARLGQGRILDVALALGVPLAEGRMPSTDLAVFRILPPQDHRFYWNWSIHRLAHVGIRLASVLRAAPTLTEDFPALARAAGIDGADLAVPGPESPGFTLDRHPDGSVDLIPRTDPASIDRLGDLGMLIQERVTRPGSILRWLVRHAGVEEESNAAP